LVQLLQLPDYKNFDVEDVVVPEQLTPELKSVDEVLTTAYISTSDKSSRKQNKIC
jgi:outer membrane protein